jgi:integrase
MKSMEIENGDSATDFSSVDFKRATIESRTRKHRGQFIAARDSRNCRVPGLYIRNGRFYAVLWSDRGDGRKTTRRFPLFDDNDAPVRTISSAKAALITLRESNKRNALPQTGRKPRFDAFSAEYLEMASTRAKRARTQEKEKAAMELWRGHLCDTRIDRINTSILKSFMEKRLRGCRIGKKNFAPASPRTVALDLIAVRNVLKAAIDAGHLRDLPRFPKIKTPPPPRRPPLTPEEFQKLLTCCFAKKPNGEALTKNGQQLHEFLRLLAFTGAREQEALNLRWVHVDFERRRIFIGADENFTAAATTIGSGGTSKNRGSRIVDFNPQLEALLREMKSRRAPDSVWLFPSPQRGEKDIRAKTLRESLKLVRAEAGLPNVGFHDLRHLFCSFSVMADIDFMTIASWLGHKDGGILIGKVYGHLLDEHRQKMAAKLTIGLTPVPDTPRLEVVQQSS